MRKLRSSTKIFIGFVAVVGVSWFAYNKIQDFMIMGQVFPPIPPTKVNIVGVTPVGYRIIISNEVAQLVETQGGFQADQSDSESSSTEGSIKKKISVKDMLGVLQGSSKSLSAFLMAMNDMNENDLPPVRVEWEKSDIQKALDGDKVLQAKLEHDLNMSLDGKPLSKLNIPSIENGIVLKIPITVQVDMGGSLKPVTGDMSIAYKPAMIKAVEADLAAEQGKIDNTTIAGYYKQEGEKVLNGKRMENIRNYLKDQISDDQMKSYADYPQKILKTAFVVVNSNYIENADYSTYTSSNGKPLYDLHVHLNDEGRRRLWQYSRQRVGDQILLTSDGVAIAAARIQQPLMGGDVTITQMTDQGLLDDLLATIKSSKSEKVAHN